MDSTVAAAFVQLVPSSYWNWPRDGTIKFPPMGEVNFIPWEDQISYQVKLPFFQRGAGWWPNDGPRCGEVGRGGEEGGEGGGAGGGEGGGGGGEGGAGTKMPQQPPRPGSLKVRTGSHKFMLSFVPLPFSRYNFLTTIAVKFPHP